MGPSEPEIEIEDVYWPPKGRKKKLYPMTKELTEDDIERLTLAVDEHLRDGYDPY